MVSSPPVPSTLLLLLLAACTTTPVGQQPLAPPPEVETAAPPAWPAEGAPLHLIPAPTLDGRSLRMVIDAGHGAPGNLGTTSVRCEREADFTRRTQDAELARLGASEGLTLLAGRPTADLVTYADRIAAFNQWQPDAVISLHSDARLGDGWTQDPHTGCWSGLGAPGFTVLYSDEGPEDRVEARLRLARAVSARMAEAGFLPYDGSDYQGLYGADEAEGVFVDRHPVGKRIWMLRAVRAPLVIVETHQAVDPEEVARWDEPATLDAFASALRAAVADAAGP